MPWTPNKQLNEGKHNLQVIQVCYSQVVCLGHGDLVALSMVGLLKITA